MPFNVVIEMGWIVATSKIRNKFIYEKLAYIHNNPVTEMVVEHPEEYRFSSAPNYADQGGLLEVVVIPQELITV